MSHLKSPAAVKYSCQTNKGRKTFNSPLWSEEKSQQLKWILLNIRSKTKRELSVYQTRGYWRGVRGCLLYKTWMPPDQITTRSCPPLSPPVLTGPEQCVCVKFTLLCAETLDGHIAEEATGGIYPLNNPLLYHTCLFGSSDKTRKQFSKLTLRFQGIEKLALCGFESTQPWGSWDIFEPTKTK